MQMISKHFFTVGVVHFTCNLQLTARLAFLGFS